MTLPPDRSHICTEQRNERSQDFDRLSTLDCVRLMADDHARVAVAVDDAAPAIAAFVDALVPRMAGGGRLVYLGAGTSGRLGVLDAAECPPTFQSDPEQVIAIIAGGDAALRKSSEGREDDPNGAADALDDLQLTHEDTVVGIAAGGTTPYVLGGLELASRHGAMTCLLTCAHPPTSSASFDHVINLQTGPELLTGSTRLKAGSATKLALNIISTATFTRLGKVYSNLMVDLRARNDKLRDRAIRIFTMLCPDQSRDDAASWLNCADGDLKTAIVMHQLHLDRSQATAQLARHGGSLRSVLEA